MRNTINKQISGDNYRTFVFIGFLQIKSVNHNTIQMLTSNRVYVLVDISTPPLEDTRNDDVFFCKNNTII